MDQAFIKYISTTFLPALLLPIIFTIFLNTISVEIVRLQIDKNPLILYEQVCKYQERHVNTWEIISNKYYALSISS